MSSRRMHEKGMIHLVTNRCEEGRFFLLPRPKIIRIVQYWLARALTLHGKGIEIYAFIILSNHIHILLRDTKCQLAEFMGYFQGNVGREVNVALDRRGAHFWQGHYDDQIIEGERTLWNKYCYVVTNAVKSGLVMRAAEWGGWSSYKMAMSEEPFSISEVDKTRYHNASRGNRKPAKAKFVDTYTFELTPLPMLQGLAPEDRKRIIQAKIAHSERHYRARWKNRTPLGMKKVMAQRWSDRPKDFVKRPKRRFACDSEEREQELKEIYQTFVADYMAVFDDFRKAAMYRRPFFGEWPEGSYPPACWRPVFEI